MFVKYKHITKFFEKAVLEDGRTDVQSHVGFVWDAKYANTDEVAAVQFGGMAVEYPLNTEFPHSRYIYVYAGDGYEEIADKAFKACSASKFVIEDASGQRVLCWEIE